MEKIIEKKLELLAPAANAEVACAAIDHGADAVYIGAMTHGARKSASNSLDDIAGVVDYAHRFRSKVYVTVNTIVYDRELKEVEQLCRDLYHIGVDALIVQDMGLLRLDLPPIALHASTQCDIRTPEKALFLQKVGFSQLVLARELTLGEISAITEAVDVPVESFIHGALCVSYSGRCHASCAATGRSANRGECAQICRLPFTLRDASGKILSRDRHLLSLRDFNATESLPELIKAGVSSFKIEGRLKDVDYVKNVTAHYNRVINGIIADYGERDGIKLRRSSYGETILKFEPNPEKSFNRGFTDYFLSHRKPTGIASIQTPKSMGEPIADMRLLNNGDGISYFTKDGEYAGARVNRIEGRRIITANKVNIPAGAEIHRTFDVEWQKMMTRQTSERKINVDIKIDEAGVSACDERGVAVRLPLEVTKDVARKEMDYSSDFSKLGNTVYKLRNYVSELDPKVFIPRSEITALRRELISQLDIVNTTNYKFDYRREEDKNVKYPFDRLDFKDNVSNRLADEFYRSHGVKDIEKALEVSLHKVGKGLTVMTTRHCILRELGMCRKERGNHPAEPLTITGGGKNYRLRFNCRDCEMEVVSD